MLNRLRQARFEQLERRIGRDAAARLLELSKTTPVSLKEWVAGWDESDDPDLFDEVLKRTLREKAATPEAFQVLIRDDPDQLPFALIVGDLGDAISERAALGAPCCRCGAASVQALYVYEGDGRWMDLCAPCRHWLGV